MRIFWGYFGSVLLSSALLAPVAYFLLEGVLSYPFHRYMNRLLMVNALLFVIVFRRHFKVEWWYQCGFKWEIDSWRQFCSGIFIGGGSLFVLVSLEWMLGGRHGGGDYEFWHVCDVLMRSCLVAILVAPAEEFLFRWVFQRAIIKPLREWQGIVTLSFLFALLHFFLKVPPEFKPDSVKWYSGLEALSWMIQPLLDPSTYGPKFLSLFFAGISLSWLVVRTGTLWASVALHGSWIFFRELTVRLSLIPPWKEQFWWASDVTSGGLALIMLALISVGIWFYYPRYTRT